MTPDEDEHIANLLRAAAPPARDAIFRLGVLERRERQRFQRRSLLLLAAALASVLCFWIGLGAGAGLAGTAMILCCVRSAGRFVFSLRARGEAHNPALPRLRLHPRKKTVAPSGTAATNP